MPQPTRRSYVIPATQMSPKSVITRAMRSFTRHIWATSLRRPKCIARGTLCLLLKDLFNLPDLFLDLAGELFSFPTGLQVGVVRNLSDFLLYFALRLMELTFDLILGTRFHFFSPFLFPFRGPKEPLPCWLARAMPRSPDLVCLKTIPPGSRARFPFGHLIALEDQTEDYITSGAS